MVSKSTREAARGYIISQGGGYHRLLLTRNGVEAFSDLPGAELKRQASAARAVAAAEGVSAPEPAVL